MFIFMRLCLCFVMITLKSSDEIFCTQVHLPNVALQVKSVCQGKGRFYLDLFRILVLVEDT